MADYTQVNDYSAKDALSTGNPLKLIKGSDVDQEFAAISVAIASKFDSTDIATAGEAQAGTSNTVVITPARLTAWAQNAAGIIEDIQALADPNADRLLGWDDSAGAAVFFTIGTGIDVTGTTLSVDIDAAGASRTLTAGNGLSGGGTLAADRTFDLDFNELAAATPVTGDEFAFGDISDTNTVKKVTLANLNAALDHDTLSGFVANEHIDLSTITITAGVGLSYSVGGTDLTADSTIDLDVNSLTTELTLDASLDTIAFYDASATAMRKVAIGSLIGDALGDGKWYRNTTTALTTTAQTMVFNTADGDNLERGTFNTSTGEYTAGSSGARIWVSIQIRVASMSSNQAPIFEIQKDGVNDFYISPRRSSAADTVATGGGIVNLAASEVLRVRGSTSGGTGTAQSGVAGTNISIQELG